MTFTSVVEGLNHYQDQLSQVQGTIGQASMAQKAHQLQIFFNQNLWIIISQLELPQHQSQWNSMITEIHRHMRLLTVEISFAQAANHSDTRQQRLGQIKQRLEQLQGFTQVLLNLLEI